MLNIYKIIRRPKYVKLLFYKKISKNLSKVLCLFYLIWQILIIIIIIIIYIYIYIVELWSPDNDVVVLSFIKLRTETNKVWGVCGFRVSELQFELVVPMGLPNCTMGRRTMIATYESPFFTLKKKKLRKNRTFEALSWTPHAPLSAS